MTYNELLSTGSGTQTNVVTPSDNKFLHYTSPVAPVSPGEKIEGIVDETDHSQTTNEHSEQNGRPTPLSNPVEKIFSI